MPVWYLLGTLIINGFYGETNIQLDKQFQFSTKTECMDATDRINAGEIIGLRIRTDDGYKRSVDKRHWKLTNPVCQLTHGAS